MCTELSEINSSFNLVSFSMAFQAHYGAVQNHKASSKQFLGHVFLKASKTYDKCNTSVLRSKMR